jgi:hypothetical protein
MQEKHLYEYAVIRVLPRVEREEFLNVGIIIFCKREKFLRVKYQLDPSRLRCLANEFDLEQIEKNLESFVKICKGEKDGGPIATMDVPSRFRWLNGREKFCDPNFQATPGIV